jgi:hypothetical protein
VRTGLEAWVLGPCLALGCTIAGMVLGFKSKSWTQFLPIPHVRDFFLQAVLSCLELGEIDVSADSYLSWCLSIYYFSWHCVCHLASIAHVKVAWYMNCCSNWGISDLLWEDLWSAWLPPCCASCLLHFKLTGFIKKFWGRAILGVELRVSHLLGRCLPLESLWQPFFVLDIFQIGSCHLFAQADF